MLSQNKRFNSKAYCLRFSATLLLTSLVAGVGGILLHDLLELVEWMIFGHGESTGAQPVTNLQFIIILLAGIISAFIWFVLQDKNRQIISIKSQLKATGDSKRPILWIHLIHIFLQVASVGAGSPIGKEGAPRELGALGAGRISDRMTLTLKDRRLAIVCGASAGLAAVYQVPIASIFFAFETLGLGLSFLNLISVSSTAILASLIAGTVISDTPLYHSGQVVLDAKTCGLTILLAILITPLAQLFRHLTQKAQASKVTTKSILWKLPLTFLLLASCSLYFPEILGNGGALAQAVFDGMCVWYALACVVIKAVLVLLTLKKWCLRRHSDTLIFNRCCPRILGSSAVSIGRPRTITNFSYVNWLKYLFSHYHERSVNSCWFGCVVYGTISQSSSNFASCSHRSLCYKNYY